MASTNPLLIALKGPLGCGKTTGADYLCKEYGFQRVSFAGPLKEAAMKITPDGRIDKKRDRALLQFLGTEYFRSIDEDYWVKKFIETACSYLQSGISVVTDDCRFLNEKLAVKREGGYLIYIVTDSKKIEDNLLKRDGVVNKGIAGHASEADNNPDDPLIDVKVFNDSSQSNFEQSLDIAIDHLLKVQAEENERIQSASSRTLCIESSDR